MKKIMFVLCMFASLQASYEGYTTVLSTREIKKTAKERRLTAYQQSQQELRRKKQIELAEKQRLQEEAAEREKIRLEKEAAEREKIRLEQEQQKKRFEERLKQYEETQRQRRLQALSAVTKQETQRSMLRYFDQLAIDLCGGDPLATLNPGVNLWSVQQMRKALARESN